MLMGGCQECNVISVSQTTNKMFDEVTAMPTLRAAHQDRL